VTHLRQIMLEELRRRNYAESTIHAYIHTVEHFSRTSIVHLISLAPSTFASIRPRGSSIEPDHARKWDPITLKADDGTRHVRRWIRDRDCSKASVRRHWRSGSLTSRCNRELEEMVAG
jgi:hypothetical protein